MTNEHDHRARRPIAERAPRDEVMPLQRRHELGMIEIGFVQ